MRIVNLRRRLLPDYAVIPAVLWVVGQVLSFYATRFVCAWIYGGYENFFDLSTKIDSLIPLSANWIYIYVLTYPFWLVSFVWIAWEGKEMCCKAFAADFLGKIACAIIFIALPSYMIRPEVQTEGPATWLLNFIYIADSPDNLFPSMHCSVSYFAARYVLRCRKIPNWYKIISVVMAVLVFFSVVLVKQHLFVDILGGIAIAEICTQLSDRLKLYKLYFKLDLGKYYERKVKEIG